MIRDFGYKGETWRVAAHGIPGHEEVFIVYIGHDGTEGGPTGDHQASIDRMSTAWPNAHLVHLPVHASWLDQCEIYFSVVQRKVLTPNDFLDLDQIRARLTAFEARYNAVATPFNWKFTRHDLDDLLKRIDAHDNHPENPRLAA